MQTDWTGLAGVLLALLVLLVRMQRMQALDARRRWGVLLAAAVIFSIPVMGLSLAGLVRGITADLSAPTLVLLALAMLRAMSGLQLLGVQARRDMLAAIALCGVLFYPLALGVSVFDPYRLGYGNVWFLSALSGVAVWSALRYSIMLAWCMALAVVAWAVGWYESNNLWDYLIDPWVTIYACYSWLHGFWTDSRKEQMAASGEQQEYGRLFV